MMNQKGKKKADSSSLEAYLKSSTVHGLNYVAKDGGRWEWELEDDILI